MNETGKCDACKRLFKPDKKDVYKLLCYECLDFVNEINCPVCKSDLTYQIMGAIDGLWKCSSSSCGFSLDQQVYLSLKNNLLHRKKTTDEKPDGLAFEKKANNHWQKICDLLMRSAEEVLAKRMRRILVARFGLRGKQPQTLEEIGKSNGLTRERIRQLISKSVRVLKSNANSKAGTSSSFFNYLDQAVPSFDQDNIQDLSVFLDKNLVTLSSQMQYSFLNAFLVFRFDGNEGLLKKNLSPILSESSELGQDVDLECEKNTVKKIGGAPEKALDFNERIVQRNRRYPNASKSWTSEEEKSLKDMYRCGFSVKHISDNMGRTPGGITSRLKKLNVFHSENTDSPNMTDKRDYALKLLRVATQNPKAEFREGQWESIDHVVNSSGPLLVVERTGWGKSLVYFIATSINRRLNKKGLTLLVSPLLSLMRNQVKAASKTGIRSSRIDSSNNKEWPQIISSIRNDEIDLLLISPERLSNRKFFDEIYISIVNKIGMLVIDEAHCISDWGHDFRPDYRRISNIVRSLRNAAIIGTTATANNRVIEDLRDNFTTSLKVQRGNLARDNLRLQTLILNSRSKRLAWLADNLGKIKGTGIIYVLTVGDSIMVSDWLNLRGHKVASYTGKHKGREKLEEDLLNCKYKALVSTSALGMGFDMPNCSFVIHYQRPSSVIAYYQQAGRAGRGIPGANCIMFSGAEDGDIHEYFVRTAFPSKSSILLVIEALALSEKALSVYQLEAKVNLPKKLIAKILKLMSLESQSPVIQDEKDSNKWIKTPNDVPNSYYNRVESVYRIRKKEQEEMDDYANLNDGHMEFLMKALDSPVLEYIPSPGTPKPLPGVDGVDVTTVNEANHYLKRTNIKIAPRKQFPNRKELGLDSAKIAVEEAMEEGRALAYWGDDGWGQLVKKGKNQDGCFSDKLVEVFCMMIRDHWKPSPFPSWVTSVPSLDHPELVADFAKEVAGKLKIPYSPAIVKLSPSRPQKKMMNNSHQLKNIKDVFEVNDEMVLNGGVFLIDDVVDSRWTLTWLGKLLRKKNVPKVFPATLAAASTVNLTPVNE